MIWMHLLCYLWQIARIILHAEVLTYSKWTVWFHFTSILSYPEFSLIWSYSISSYFTFYGYLKPILYSGLLYAFIRCIKFYTVQKIMLLINTCSSSFSNLNIKVVHLWTEFWCLRFNHISYMWLNLLPVMWSVTSCPRLF